MVTVTGRGDNLMDTGSVAEAFLARIPNDFVKVFSTKTRMFHKNLQ